MDIIAREFIGPNLPSWLRDVRRYEHTIAVSVIDSEGNHDSWGQFLNNSYVTEGGDFIGEEPEVKAFAAVWYAANKFHDHVSAIRLQTEQTCNVIAVLEKVSRHDVVLDDETWEIVANMQPCGREEKLLRSTIRELETILIAKTKSCANKVRGVFRPKYKDKIEGRLYRLLAEQEAIIASFEAIMPDLGLPQTAYEVRQYVLSQLLINVEEALEIITPTRRQVKDAPLPEEFRRRIVENEAVLFRARSQLKKWRDNPSRKFGSKMKEMALLLLKTSSDIAMLKDESYHALSKLGCRFFNRCGHTKNPYF